MPLSRWLEVGTQRMTTLHTTLTAPRAIIFDWHGTLVDTQDAAAGAMEETLERFEELGLIDSLIPEEDCASPGDVKLVRYIRIFRRLQPKILVERRINRTEIFNAIFGNNQVAKRRAHEAYNRCYRRHFGKVKALQPGTAEYLRAIRKLNIKLGIATNRSREFFDQELRLVDDGSWPRLFDATTCADESSYKPDPKILRHTLANMTIYPGQDAWYIGDGFQDMVTAKKAGVTAIFYNGGCWDELAIKESFSDRPEYSPDAVINSLDELMDLLANVQQSAPAQFPKIVDKVRPTPFPGPTPAPQHIEPDWHPSVAKLQAPDLILFDWHATLVDTLDAMYRAVDDLLPELKEEGLLNRLVAPADCKSPEDARLVEYVQSFNQLHPKIKADRKISRTDIFEVLFGSDQEAKQAAHRMFNHHYRNHFGTVLPFEPSVREVLRGLRRLGIPMGIITNRDREFFNHEVKAVEQGSWQDLFQTVVCGDDTARRKPYPDQLIKASHNMGQAVTEAVWYVGDSTTDVSAAKQAGMTSVFFNGAQWDLPWLEKIFPGTPQYPYRPDVVVNDFSEFWALVLACLNHIASAKEREQARI